MQMVDLVCIVFLQTGQMITHEDEDWVECDGYWLKGREGGYISTDYEGETPEGCTRNGVYEFRKRTIWCLVCGSQTNPSDSKTCYEC